MSGTQERIQQLRRQILVHSVLYYRMNDTVWTDAQFDSAAAELVRMQADYPSESAAVEYMREEFADFDGGTGFHLPLNDPQANNIAKWLLERMRGGE